MPDFTYDDSTSTFAWETSVYPTIIEVSPQYDSIDLMQQLWEEHQQMIDQQEKQAEELRKDKVNYPLFFWKDKK